MCNKHSHLLRGSDIDLMIHNTDSNPAACLADPLTELFNELKLNHKSKLRFEEDVPSIRLISARVPIIKLVSAIGKDVSLVYSTYIEKVA